MLRLASLAAILFARRIVAFNASDFLVKGLDEIEPAYAEFDGDMYAGPLPIDIVEPGQTNKEKRGELMFWMFKPKKDLDSLTIWLNGGPGCSSISAGNLFETAPVTSPHFRAGYPNTTFDEPLIVNEWAWTRATNMLFIEQPTNVGFSWGPTVNSEADLSQDFYNFMQNFYSTFPEMASKRLFIFGESYAGMYVPSIAHKIHTENTRGHHRRINLKGIGIGNGACLSIDCCSLNHRGCCNLKLNHALLSFEQDGWMHWSKDQ